MPVEIEVPLPARMTLLPKDHRGYPVPWFVYREVDGEPITAKQHVPGSEITKYDFRVIRPGGVEVAIRESRCWVCGQKRPKYGVFVIGPMCAVNRTSAEPPSHRSCAIFSAKACPFLAKPKMHRRENNKIEDATHVPGIMLDRNPGVTLVWGSDRWHMFQVPQDGGPGQAGTLFDIGPPNEVHWYAEGREATRDEITHSIDTGLPSLRELADLEGPDATAELDRRLEAARELLPAA